MNSRPVLRAGQVAPSQGRSLDRILNLMDRKVKPDRSGNTDDEKKNFQSGVLRSIATGHQTFSLRTRSTSCWRSHG